MKIGVVRFPGSCDEVDALQAAQRVGDAELLWYADHDLRGADAVIVPGGFSYGDYLRVGAIARFAPVMEEVERFARSGGPVLGICNGFQVLCEAGLLPGALLPNTSLRFLCRQVGITVASAATAWTRECSPGEALSIPVKHTTGRYYAPEPVLDELEAAGQVTFRYAPGQNPNGSARDIAGVANAAGNVVGLMPHPEHAVDALTGSEDGICLFRSVVGDGRARRMTVATRHRELGLTDAEYDRIVEHMEGEPNEVELAVFSLMWSEHCAYKHSKRLLRSLPTEGPRVVMGPGENAGAVSVGGGLACAFKVESHNHPSAVEPFQGAATGVGGILRDVFAVGARPIAILDSLRFGEVERSARSRYLLERAVAGIGHYGNSIGVATVGGEIYFEDAYEQNCLVNAMCLGLIDEDRLIRSAAAGVGNVVLLFGARTGRDGIGGASVLASAELDELDAAKRPTVQIGDPFEEKKLLECSLELLDRDLLVALQDLGAAGLTSSSAEMASKGEVGIDIDVRKVPLREADMEAFEIMISESQERMLCVVEPSRVDEVISVCEKWLVNATAIGEVTDTRRLRVFDDGALVGDMPVTALVDECPLYDLEPVAPAVSMYPAPPAVLRRGGEPAGDTLLALLRSANLASRRWAFEQYDCLVGSRTVRRPEQADAAVLALPTASPDGSSPASPRSALAVSIDGNGRRVACDPYRGAVEAVLECSANLACVGAEPLGLTNCLNFGNPEKPHIAWQLTRAVAGLADACRALSIPVVGGNVSLYNEAGAGPIFPTPVVGLVGELPRAERSGRLGFAQDGDVVAVISAGSWAPAPTGSELAKLRGEAPFGELPQADLGELRTLHAAVRQGVRAGALRSAHDVAEGGLAVALAECCLAGGRGARVDLSALRPNGEALLFGEGPGAFVVSGPEQALRAFGGAAVRIGEVGGSDLELAGTLRVAVAQLAAAHAGGLADLMG